MHRRKSIEEFRKTRKLDSSTFCDIVSISSKKWLDVVSERLGSFINTYLSQEFAKAIVACKNKYNKADDNTIVTMFQLQCMDIMSGSKEKSKMFLMIAEDFQKKQGTTLNVAIESVIWSNLILMTVMHNSEVVEVTYSRIDGEEFVHGCFEKVGAEIACKFYHLFDTRVPAMTRSKYFLKAEKMIVNCVKNTILGFIPYDYVMGTSTTQKLSPIKDMVVHRKPAESDRDELEAEFDRSCRVSKGSTISKTTGPEINSSSKRSQTSKTTRTYSKIKPPSKEPPNMTYQPPQASVITPTIAPQSQPSLDFGVENENDLIFPEDSVSQVCTRSTTPIQLESEKMIVGNNQQFTVTAEEMEHERVSDTYQTRNIY